MTPEDKKRIEEIRSAWNPLLRYENREGFPDDDVTFLLARLDEAEVEIETWKSRAEINGKRGFELQDKLDEAHAALRELHNTVVSEFAGFRFEKPLGKAIEKAYKILSPNEPKKVCLRKALDGSTDPDTGTKGSLGEE